MKKTTLYVTNRVYVRCIYKKKLLVLKFIGKICDKNLRK